MTIDNITDITQFIHHKLNFCSYVGVSDELEVAIVDAHFISTNIEKKDILAISKTHCLYRINFNIDAVFGFKQMQYGTLRTDLTPDCEAIYQHHALNLVLDVEIVFNNIEGQKFKILANVPPEIDVYYDEGEYIDWRNKNRYH